MPRILVIKVGWRLWVAFTLDDYGTPHDVRWGVSESHARDRTLDADLQRDPSC